MAPVKLVLLVVINAPQPPLVKLVPPANISIWVPVSQAVLLAPILLALLVRFVLLDVLLALLPIPVKPALLHIISIKAAVSILVLVVPLFPVIPVNLAPQVVSHVPQLLLVKPVAHIFIMVNV